MFEKLKVRFTQTKYFQQRLKIFQLWNTLRLNEIQEKNQHFTTLDLKHFHIISHEEIPSFRNQKRICHEKLIKKLIQTLKVIKSIDETLPTSLQMYQQKFNKVYEPISLLENWNAMYLDRDVNDNEFIFKNSRNLKILEEISQSKDLESLKTLQELENERMQEFSKKWKERIGWNLNMQEKLRIEGKCSSGNIIGMYPGMIYHHLIKKSIPLNSRIQKLEFGEMINGNLQNEIFFNSLHNHEDPIQSNSNSKSFLEKFKEFEKSGSYEELETKIGIKFNHPLSITCKMNTNPIPNVIGHSLRIPLEFPRELLAYIPNKYFTFPDGIIQCLVFVNKRNLKNEEIFQ
jgi:hypothetical protein